MEINTRIGQILEIMLTKDCPLTDQEIADSIGVSKRTIQRQLEYIEHSLRDYGLVLSRKKGQGIWIDGKEEQKALLLSRVTEQTLLSVDKEKRRKRLIFELLRDNTPKKLFYYSDLLGVSEATISNDLNAIEPWLNKSHMQVVKKPGFGVVVYGFEKNYRQAIQRFINENTDDVEIKKLFNDNEEILNEIRDKAYANGNVYELINSEIMGRVSRAMRTIDNKRLRHMTDNSYISLIMHIAIAMDRIKAGELIEAHGDYVENYSIDEDYQVVEEIISAMEKEFDLLIPEVEIPYILLHIKGSKLKYSKGDTITDKELPDGAELLDLVDHMIDAFDQNLSYELKCDEEFIQGLLVHLEPTLIRLQNEMTICNPLLNEIKEEYGDIFDKCIAVGQVIYEHTGLLPNEDEIGFLAIHFGAATVRQNEKKKQKRRVEIGVICASGFGVARLMMTKIENKVTGDISLHAYGRESLNDFILSRTDFFISSMDLSDVDADVVYVSPLITSRDISMIDVKVQEYSRLPAKMEANDFTRQLDRINNTIIDIRTLIRNFQIIKLPADLQLNQALRQISDIATESPQAAALLYADIMEREHLSSQVFKDYHFALLHCKTRAVREVTFKVFQPEAADAYCSSDLADCRVLILLLMPHEGEGESRKELLGSISQALIEDDEFLPVLTGSDEEVARKRLQKNLQRFFNQYLNAI